MIKSLNLKNVTLQKFFGYFYRVQTPGSDILDQFMSEQLRPLVGKVVELGAVSDKNKSRVLDPSGYIQTNIKHYPGGDILDATQNNLPNNSVDAYISEVMLEHLYDYQSVIDGCFNSLKSNGKLIMVAPWMYPYHLAPGDYFRFSKMALLKMHGNFSSVEIFQLGDFWLTLSQFIQLKAWPWSLGHKVPKKRILKFLPILCVGAILYLFSSLKKNKEDEFALLYGIVATK